MGVFRNKMAVSVTARIHPIVLFSIVDSYERRNEDAKRVIGTLLGTYEKGGVEVTNCFTVPHTEGDEVAVDMDFARTMFELHKQVNRGEQVVGWYSTGSEVTEHSLLLHEYYAREAKNPIHLTVDTTLRTGHMGAKGYVSTSMGVPGKALGTIFTPISIEITAYDPERVGLDFISQAKHNPKRTVAMTGDMEQVTTACTKLQDMLSTVLQYVDDVMAGRISADNAVGRHLMSTIQSIPRIDPEKFQDMLNDNMKDLLMVVYLSNLTKTQLALTEKLTHI